MVSPALIILIAGLLVVLIFLFLFLRRKPKTSSLLVADALSRPREGFIAPLKRLFGAGAALEKILPELEEALLAADVGVSATTELIDALSCQKDIASGSAALDFLKARILEKLNPKTPFLFPQNRPAVFFFVGINGTGKTTTIAKLASRFHDEGKKVLVVGGDTFRAAAGSQLKTWAERVGADYVGGAPESDPASVIFDGLKAAKARGAEVVLVDTAGRLHTKIPLMDELKKMVRVAEKELGRAPDEIFLVLDGTTGQNGLMQARVFQDAVPLTGLVLTKFDGTSRGGILISVVAETGLPLRFVGVGEKPENLKSFDPAEFVGALFE